MATSYDQVPYPCNAYPQTHPDHLATLALLQGLKAAPPTKCRYLEIGCGDGGNLIPLAHTLPESQFLGIDLASTSIESACHHASAVGLSNVELRALDLMDLDAASLGHWDYIVAHGVFSWVPDPVRLRLLALIRELLAPTGVAFISYNAYPGCHIRHMTRDMLLYHTENAPDAETKISQARSLMSFLSQSHGVDDEYGTLLRAEAARISNYAPNHLYHDDLAGENQPFYLHQFADLAQAQGLQYLGDADYASMHATRYPPAVQQILATLGDDPIRLEQYLDFIKCRRFRQTLLCHQSAQLSRATPLELMRELYFSSAAKPSASDANLLDESTVHFLGEGGLKGEAAIPAAKLALAYLGLQWPARVAYADLHSAISGALGSDPDPGMLETVLREFIQMGAAEPHLQPALYTTQLGERPRASDLALYQQRLGGRITTLRHHTVQFSDPFGLWLLGQLDGTRTLEQVAHALASTVKPDAEGRLDFDKELLETRSLVTKGLQKFVGLGLICQP
jgi:SAM-dependent methyltransferase